MAQSGKDLAVHNVFYDICNWVTKLVIRLHDFSSTAVLHFIAQSLSLSSHHDLNMTLIMLKGYKSPNHCHQTALK